MRLIQFAATAGFALLVLGCSRAWDGASALIVSSPRIEVVRLPGIPPPAHVRVAHQGVASEGCANNDGPAVELVFKVENELPTASAKDQSTTGVTLVFGPPLLGNQELHIRVNATLAKVKGLEQWTIGNPDMDGGLLAWVCPVGGFPCDLATGDAVTFTGANDEFIEGEANLVFQSGNTVVVRFSAKLTPLSTRSGPFLCG